MTASRQATVDAHAVGADRRAKSELSIIPLTRIQSVSLYQGPIQRWRHVASVRAALVPGPVASLAEHVEAGRSLELWAQLSQASKVRREAEAPERWLSRVTEIVEATSRRAEGDK